MGWVEARGSGHIARYRKDGKVISVGGFDSANDAKIFLASVITDTHRGDYIDPRAGDAPLSEWITEWQQGRLVKATTAAGDAGMIRNHVLPSLGDKPLRDITPSVVRRWVVKIGKGGLSPKSVRNCHGMLYVVMAQAVAEGLIRKNPCEGTPLPEVARPELRILTPQEVERLIAATPEPYRPLVVLLAGTGMRWGEAVGLKVGRVDVLGGTVSVVETLSEVNGKLAYGTPKTKTSRRTITIARAAREALVPLVSGKSSGDPVFTTEEGALLRRNNFLRRVWRPAYEAAGITPAPRVHDLRHAHVSMLIASGIPLLAISRRLGHASISVTGDVYGHLLPEVDEHLLAAIDAALPSAREATAHHLPTNAHT